MNEGPTRATVDPDPGVASRWWYWIAAYPVVVLLVLPVIAFIGVVALVPLAIVGPDAPMAPTLVWTLFVIFAGIIVFVLLVGLLAVFVMLPIALFFDAKAVQASAIDWDPDPIVYAVLALLQFVITPIIDLIVAVYYLYRRHDIVGVP